MRLARPLSRIVLVALSISTLFLSLMVSCGALGCSWERATDARGLNRHRASCHLFKKTSVLASQKRQERAKEAAFAHLAADLSVNTSHVSSPSI
jgi:hypothetical protein